MNRMPEVSIVIPARNAAETIAAQLEAIAHQQTSRSWEVVVVDNGSEDTTAEIARSYSDVLPALLVIEGSQGQGAAYARNLGAKYATGGRLLFCDADDIVGEGWIESLASVLDRADAAGGWLDEKLLNSPDSRAIREPLVSSYLHRGLRNYLPRAVAGNMGVRAEAFHALGGFDSSWKVLEDSEFSFRLQLAGYSLAFAADARVHFRHKPTVKEGLHQVFEWSAARPRLYAAFKGRGAPRSWGLRSAAALVAYSWWLLGGRVRRLAYFGKVVKFLGRIVGSVRARTWYV